MQHTILLIKLVKQGVREDYVNIFPVVIMQNIVIKLPLVSKKIPNVFWC